MRQAPISQLPRWLVGACLALAPLQLAWSPLGIDGIPFRLQDLLVACSAVGIASAARLERDRERRQFDSLDYAAAATVLGIALSIALALDTSLALVAGGRLLASILLFWALRRSSADRDDVVRFAAIAGAGAATLALVHHVEVVMLEQSWFVGATRRAGFFDRLTVPFSHPNVAGAFIVATTVLTSAKVACNLSRGLDGKLPTRSAALWVGALVLQSTAIWLTVSRSALAAAAVASAGTLAWGRARHLLWPFAAAFMLAGVSMVAVSDVVRFRLVPPARDELTQVDVVEAPDTLVVADRIDNIDIVVSNRSSRAYPLQDGERFRIVATWTDPGTQIRWRQSWPIDGRLLPDQQRALRIDDAVPVVAGDYDIRWDVEYLNRPFSNWSGNAATTAIEVTLGAPAPLLPPAREPRTASRPSIWATSIDMFLDRPATGVGPGNFAVASASSADGAVLVSHAHSFVLEPLATLGLFGALPFLALIGLSIRKGIRRQDSPTGLLATIAAGAIVLSGTADWPLAATSTATLFWVLLGAAAPATLSPKPTSHS